MVEWLRNEFEDLLYDVLGLLVPGIIAITMIGYEIFVKYNYDNSYMYLTIESFIKYEKFIESINMSPILIIIFLFCAYIVSTIVLGLLGILDKFIDKHIKLNGILRSFLYKVMIKKRIYDNYRYCLKEYRNENYSGEKYKKRMLLFIDRADDKNEIKTGEGNGNGMQNVGSNKGSIKKKYMSKIKFYETTVYFLRGYFWYQVVGMIVVVLKGNYFDFNSVYITYGLFQFLIFMITLIIVTDMIYLSQIYHRFLKEKGDC